MRRAGNQFWQALLTYLTYPHRGGGRVARSRGTRPLTDGPTPGKI